MTLTDLCHAMQDCNNGNLEFNIGEHRSFLHGNRWYPLRATINRAANIANEESNLTTDRALVVLVYLGIWIRISKIHFFNNNSSVIITEEQKVREVKQISKTLFNLTN